MDINFPVTLLATRKSHFNIKLYSNSTKRDRNSSRSAYMKRITPSISNNSSNPEINS